MQLKHFIKKEFRHVFRDKRTLFVLLGMPVSLILLFGYAISTDIQNASISFYDQDKSEVSKELIRSFGASSYFSIEEQVNNADQIAQIFKENRAKMVVVIPKDFGKEIPTSSVQLEFITDASDPNTANLISQYALQVTQKFALAHRIAPIEAIQVVPQIKMHYNPEMKSPYMFVPGIMAIILMLISALLTSISLTKEKEMGTMEVILVSPLKPITIIIGKVVAYFVISMVNVFLVFGMAYFVFDVPIRGSFLLLLAECMLFIMCALSLGVLISSVAKNQQIALMLSLFGLMMPTTLLSGFIFPISSMPIPLQVISNIIPAQYFLRILRAIMLKGVGFEIVWQDTLILIGITCFIIAVSVKKFKVRLQ